MTYQQFGRGVKQYGNEGATWIVRLIIAALLGVTIQKIDHLQETTTEVRVELARDYPTVAEVTREFSAIEGQIDRHVDIFHNARDFMPRLPLSRPSP